MQASTEDQERVSSPRLLFTAPIDDSGSKPNPARPRSKTVGSSSKTATGTGNDLDTPATPARRKRRATQSNKSSPSKSSRSRSSTESSFFPRLARVLESGDSSLISRSGIKGSKSGHRRDRSPTRMRRSRDEGGIRRSPVKQHRVSSVHRRSESLPSFNPSLLSVLSSLTSTSGYSSGSNTTITQQSYDCAAKSGKSEGPKQESARSSDTEQHSTTTAEVPNVFDYLDATMEDGQDSRSIRSSSSSSHYQASDAGSSELPDTPSSRSTCPSPPATRSRSVSGSVAELRRRYDPQYAASVASRSSGSQSPEVERSPPRSIKKLSQLRDVAESDEHDSDTGVSCAEVVYDARQRSASHSYAAQLPPQQQQQQSYDEQLKAQQDALRHHVAQDQHLRAHHRVDSAYGQHRSPSSSSSRSADSQRAWAQHTHAMQMQQYQQYASPAMSAAYPGPYVSIDRHGASSPPPPPAPDAPDNTHRTIAGYELLAREISDPISPVKPMYRRFEYLNHRILLHMQDELQELEEQLRCADEIVARIEPPSFRASDENENGNDEDHHHPRPVPPPASRRNERNYGSHWHHQRTELLGRIFLKTKDYNAALASFTSVTSASFSPPPSLRKDDIEVYRSWLRNKQALCPLETRFLDASTEEDLVFLPACPPQPALAGPETSSQSLPNPLGRQKQNPATIHSTSNSNTPPTTTDPHHLLAFATCLPVIPLLLFSVISTIPGRCVVTLLLTLGAMLLASSSSSGAVLVARMTELLGLEARQSVVVAAGWVLVCCGIAGCVPLG